MLVMSTIATTPEIMKITTKVRTIISEKLGVEESALTRDACFSDDLGLDSLDVLEAFVEVEKKFGIKIADEEAEKLTSLGTIVDYIAAHRN
jgi:acyl carrier protein